MDLKEKKTIKIKPLRCANYKIYKEFTLGMCPTDWWIPSNLKIWMKKPNTRPTFYSGVKIL